jgi:hypothetical protein
VKAAELLKKKDDDKDEKKDGKSNKLIDWISKRRGKK